MKDGSLTLVGVIFLVVINLIVGYQLISYRNYQEINYNLIGEYQTRVKKIQHGSKVFQ